MRNNPQYKNRILFELYQQFDNLNVNIDHESFEPNYKPKGTKVNASGKYS